MLLKESPDLLPRGSISTSLNNTSERLEEAVIKWVLDADDCLLMIESLKEDSLMEDEMHSFRGVGDRNHRQGNFSTSAILYLLCMIA